MSNRVDREVIDLTGGNGVEDLDLNDLAATELVALAAAAPVGLFVAVPPRGMVFVNDRLLEIVGRERDEVLGLRWLDLVRPEKREALESSRTELIGGSGSLDAEHTLYRPDGQARTVEVRGVRVTDAFDRDVIVGSVLDVTETRRTEASLRASEARLRDQAELLEMVARSRPLDETLTNLCRLTESELPGARCGVVLIDEEHQILRLGAAPSMPQSFVDAIQGLPAGSFAALPPGDIKMGDTVVWLNPDRAAPTPAMAALGRTHGVEAVWATRIHASSDRRLLGTLFTYPSQKRAPSSAEQAVLESTLRLAAVAVERDVYEQNLAHQAHHDALTGLPNRVLFGELLDHALNRARRSGRALAVLFLDLDGFKVVNDSLGHDAGDDLLVAIAGRLDEVLRPGDVVGRFGGDEFTILCDELDPGAEVEQARTVAQRMIEAVKEPVVIAGHEQFVSASVGVALASTGKERTESLLRDADAAMYRAKELGRGTCQIFDPNMLSRAQERHELQNALHRAVARREFRVFYQPILSLHDGLCVGAEALVRWQHPERGLLAPREFLDAAEDTGLIVDLGALVLEEACRQSMAWRRNLHHANGFYLSVNFSGRQLAQADVVDVVSEVLEQSGLPPHALGIEVTETVLMKDSDAGVATVTGLKDLGVRVAIDDFGTGYSALGYLRRFPIDDVKIDRAFVEKLGANPSDAAIVAAIVNLGHALGVTVTAEGVESRTQLEELKALGVDAAQGYLFAPPQPAGDLTARLTRSRRWF
jgi:diguanylate cyclase (GGDEF)-like protein/PAS domain S-box-containing protein